MSLLPFTPQNPLIFIEYSRIARLDNQLYRTLEPNLATVPMRNLKITIAYDGSDFSGWQVQPGRSTVQGQLSEAMMRVTGEKILPQGSGRTDAGVHALAQVASVAIENPIPLANLALALNDVLPPQIRVLLIENASPEFHARTSAHAKTYRYRIFRGSVCPPFLARYVYHHPWPLDETMMTQAAAEVIGEHDFTSFAAVDPEKSKIQPKVTETQSENSGIGISDLGFKPSALLQSQGNVRRIFESGFCREGDELVYTVRGSGFLHHMVRNLVGAFLLVGKGTLNPRDVAAILSARRRSANPGATVPANGLYLVSVEY
jgi:tRNA pseudouridine38-40 synthase